MQQISKKVILVGNFGVGKTSLVRRFVHQTFSDEYLTTLGVRIDKKVVNLANITVNMILWDVAGEVSQTKVPASYYLGSHGVIYVFDLQRPSSFENITSDIDFIRSKLPNAPICVIGNKKDLLSDAELSSIQQKLSVKASYFTSAKTGENVEAMFEMIAKQMTE
ncbi:Rab family GTPase [Microscilla marina]|uniref:Small GTP-binding protein domain n=1 Tax=Microscilla marina ATCC 23134 TaxID=313606 RepID=A1ZMS6_MICM2|nr:Rab family GTPase [Microscilla marina]EAY28456.1 small GTP-binding protein domain [Microscilla marina ATCC 23134]